MSGPAALRGLVVGGGRMGTSYAELLATRPGLELAGIVEPDPARRRALAGTGPVFPSLGEALVAAPRASFAVLAAPPDAHLEVGLELLAAGLDLLVEKPLARELPEARALVAAARAAGRTLATAAKFRTLPAVAAAAALVRSGALGPCREVEIVFSGELDPAGTWRADPKRAGGGVWIDNGPHALDLLDELLGWPEAVRAVRFERRRGLEVEDEVELETAHAGGARGRIRLSWNRTIEAPFARCACEGGTIELGWRAAVVRREDEVLPLGPGYERGAALRATLEAFLERRARAAGADPRGAVALAWIEAGYRSAATGAWERGEA